MRFRLRVPALLSLLALLALALAGGLAAQDAAGITEIYLFKNPGQRRGWRSKP